MADSPVALVVDTICTGPGMDTEVEDAEEVEGERTGTASDMANKEDSYRDGVWEERREPKPRGRDFG